MKQKSYEIYNPEIIREQEEKIKYEMLESGETDRRIMLYAILLGGVYNGINYSCPYGAMPILPVLYKKIIN